MRMRRKMMVTEEEMLIAEFWPFRVLKCVRDHMSSRSGFKTTTSEERCKD